MSSGTDFWRAQSASISTRLFYEMSHLPLTCQMQVIPGLIEQYAKKDVAGTTDLVATDRPRADSAHISSQNVEQLRQIVESRPAQKTSQGGDRGSILAFDRPPIPQRPPATSSGAPATQRHPPRVHAHKPEL